MAFVVWECSKCQQLNNEADNWCRKCSAPRPDLEITCPSCEKSAGAQNDYCPNCGANLKGAKRKLWLLQSDPALSVMNEKYRKKSVRVMQSGSAAIAAIAAFYMWLEGILPDFFFELSFLTFFVSLICFGVFNIQRMNLKKQITQMLGDAVPKHPKE